MSEPAESEQRHDSIAAIGSALSGSARARRVLLWLATVCGSGALSWIAAKVDTKLDIQHEVREQLVARDELEAQRHSQLLGVIGKLDHDLLSQDVNDPGKVIVIEKGVWLAFRALAEVRAMTLAGESARARAAKETQGASFARSFDARAVKGPPQATYDEIVHQVAVP